MRRAWRNCSSLIVQRSLFMVQALSRSQLTDYPRRHAQGVGDDRQGRSDAQGRGKKAPIDHEHVRVLEQPAVRTQDRMGGVLAEAEGPALVGDMLVRGK